MIPKLYLAPMAGYTDTVFRRICTSCGCDETVSEMISAAALHYKDEKTAILAEIEPDENNVSLQIFGHDPAMMAEAAEILLTGAYTDKPTVKPVGIDINMGCPVRKIAGNGDGSALMQNPSLAAAVMESVSAVCRRYGVRASAKIRLGWDREHINAPTFALMLAQSGADMITLHCRTKEELYTPGIHPEYLAETAKLLKKHAPGCLLIGNGDISSAEEAAYMTSLGCDGLMIGRAALGNPWIFRQIRESAAGQAPFMPTADDLRNMAAYMVHEIVLRRGEFTGIRESRGRAAHFCKGLPGSAALRDRLNHAESEAEFIAVLMG
ncbi:MAG: tRNA-dihydrouridine synthase family protein [Ruminococcaceae bacterium]|nr:tRNA-dihydrouridine synthase family protein [Oscillospiraceae bacterium]